MKKYLFLLLFLTTSFAAISQTNMYWYNPFNIQPQLMINLGVSEMIAEDTSGEFWFSAYNGVSDQLQIMNQNGTINYTVPFGFNSSGYITFDTRNILWVNVDGTWYNNASGSLNTFVLPVSSGTCISMTADVLGNDYFLYEADYPTGIDTFFVMKYNGSTFQNISLNNIGIPLNDSTVSIRYCYCDNTGALMVDCKTYGFMKYYQGSWTHIVVNGIDTNAEPLFSDNANNYYFLDGDDMEYLFKMHVSGAVDTIPFPGVIISEGLYDDITFTTGPDSAFWLISANSGFYELNSNNTWTLIPSPGFLLWYDNTITGQTNYPALFDRQGRLWTTGGASNPPYTIGVYSFIPFNSISGRVFYDANGNGAIDSGERGFTAVNIVQSTNGYYANTDTAGNFNVIFIDSTISHVISASLPTYYHLTTPSSYTIDTGHALCCYNFGVLADGNIQDIQITATSFCTAPGYDAMTWLSYQNTGTVTVSDTITYIFDTILQFSSAYPQPTYVSGNKISWAYHDLQPFQSGTIAIDFLLPIGSVIGDTLSSIATIQPLASDTTPQNNIYMNTQVISSSFDPNLKTVSPDSGTAPGETLTYTIYFQNTGTAAAVNITILDTLDANLNPATFKLLGSSSQVTTSLQGPGLLSFTFSNVNLPDSAADPIHSTGYVRFSIGIANPLKQSASSVSNTAYIYFDFNPAVQTNVAASVMSSTAGIASIQSGSGPMLSLQPNPATESVTIKLDDSAMQGTLSLYDATGKLLFKSPINKTHIVINTQVLAAGIYMVQAISPLGKTQSQKLIKQ